jgi:hypothetical protein
MGAAILIDNDFTGPKVWLNKFNQLTGTEKLNNTFWCASMDFTGSLTTHMHRWNPSVI